MALHDLFALSAMLRMQLPVLFSVAVIRWVLGVMIGGVGGRLVRRHGLSVEPIAQGLRRTRAASYAMGLGIMAAAWITERAQRGSMEHDLCGPYESVRVQGLACGVALATLFSNGNAAALAMALTALKAVADTASTAPLLACLSATLALVPTPREVYWTMLLGCLLCYTSACLSIGTGVPNSLLLAVCFVALRLLGRFCALAVALWVDALVKAARGVRKLVVQCAFRHST